MTRSLLFALVLLPRITFGQSDVAPSYPVSAPAVEAIKVEVGLGTKLMQVASIAFDPWQRNTHWPLFAYPVGEVFESRPCESFANAPLEGDVAFVFPESSGTNAPSKFQGFQIRQASQIRDICNSEDHATELRRLLGSGHGTHNDEWYLLSERPLRHLRSSFRTNMIPVNDDAGNGNALGATESETPRSTR